MTAPLLLADAVGELMKVLVIVLFIVVPAVGQLIAKMRQAAQQRRGPAPRLAGGGRVQDEIDEFLRRAAQRRDRGPGEPAEAIEAEVVPEEPVGAHVGEDVRRYLDTSDFTRRTSVLGEEVAQADDVFDQRSQSVFGHEVSRLAGKPGESAVPPQSAGTGAEAQAEAIAAEPAAVGLFALLTEPENFRQAIVMSEILNRPAARWE